MIDTHFTFAAGFVAAVNKTPIAIGWTRIYQMSYIVNIALASSIVSTGWLGH